MVIEITIPISFRLKKKGVNGMTITKDDFKIYFRGDCMHISIAYKDYHEIVANVEYVLLNNCDEASPTLISEILCHLETNQKEIENIIENLRGDI